MRIDRSDLIYLLDHVHAEGGETDTANIYIDYPNGLSISQGPPGITSTTMVTIYSYNNGLYDVSRYPPCTRDYGNEDGCLKGIAAEAESEVCNWTQFTKFLDISLRKNETGRPPKKFCTPTIYKECQERALEEASKRQEKVKKEGACTPCVFAKNMFTISPPKEIPELYNRTPLFASTTS